MARSLFVGTPFPTVKKSYEYNSINGNDAETFAAKQLLSALGGQINSSSRNEDNRQIDLYISYDHPWFNNERLVIASQIKSGKSYGRRNGSGFVLYSKAKEPSIKSVHPMCVVWVDTLSSQAFWAFIHSNSKGASQEYGSHHKVSPPMRYDLARCQSRFIRKKVGGQGIVMSDLKEKFFINRKKVSDYYKKLGRLTIFSPCLGKIECTKLGWRHMFRKTRSAINKNQSVTTIRYLDKILEQYPSRIIATKTIDIERFGYNHRTTEFSLSFDKVKFFNANLNNSESVSVKIRLIEEIRYYSDWERNFSTSQLIQRKLILLSCYFKKGVTR